MHEEAPHPTGLSPLFSPLPFLLSLSSSPFPFYSLESTFILLGAAENSEPKEQTSPPDVACVRVFACVSVRACSRATQKKACACALSAHKQAVQVHVRGV